MKDNGNDSALESVYSTSRKTRIDIIKRVNGCFGLRKYSSRYDREEGVEYFILDLPGPAAIFDSLQSARKEALRLLGLE